MKGKILVATAAVVLLLATGGIAAATTPAAPPATPAPVVFDPAVHGFHFDNAFTQHLVVQLPWSLGSIDFGTIGYGLCGGMSFAAADSWTYRVASPGDTSAPGLGTALNTYLLMRQIDSLQANNWDTLKRLIKWTSLPTNDKNTIFGHVTGLGTRTMREYRGEIHPRLAKGELVPLALVKASFFHNVKLEDIVSGHLHLLLPDLGQLFKNHQVLATGDLTNSSGKPVIAIYDPNYHDQTMYLQLGARTETSDRNGLDVVDRFRGLFHEPYQAKKPYWAV